VVVSKALANSNMQPLIWKPVCMLLTVSLPNWLVEFHKNDEHENRVVAGIRCILAWFMMWLATTDYVFHQFGNNACQTNRSVVGALIFLPFPEIWCNVCFMPIPRNNTIMQWLLEYTLCLIKNEPLRSLWHNFTNS